MSCGINTSEIHEYYMLTDETWLKAVPDRLGMLCIQCVEAVLGRKLSPHDFDPAWTERLSEAPISDLLSARRFGGDPIWEYLPKP